MRVRTGMQQQQQQQQQHSERVLSPIFGSYGGRRTIPPISSRSLVAECARSYVLGILRYCPLGDYAAGSLYSPEIAYLVNCSRYGSAAAAAGDGLDPRTAGEEPFCLFHHLQFYSKIDGMVESSAPVTY